MKKGCGVATVFGVWIAALGIYGCKALLLPFLVRYEICISLLLIRLEN
jgi:hypothetical protein